MKYEIERTEPFDKWLKNLKDRKAVLEVASSYCCCLAAINPARKKT